MRAKLRLFRLDDAMAKPKRVRARQTAPVRAAPAAAVVEAALAAVDAPAGQRIICDWPPNILSANSRAHWSKATAPRAAYRRACWALALQAKVTVPAEGDILVRLDMFPPDTISLNDDDNAAARFKAGRDGIAAALKVNDRRFKVTPVLHAEPLACMVFTIIDGGNE